jgi:hypothetical protein
LIPKLGLDSRSPTGDKSHSCHSLQTMLRKQVSASWPPSQSKSSELEERAGHGPDQTTGALHASKTIGVRPFEEKTWSRARSEFQYRSGLSQNVLSDSEENPAWTSTSPCAIRMRLGKRSPLHVSSSPRECSRGERRARTAPCHQCSGRRSGGPWLRSLKASSPPTRSRSVSPCPVAALALVGAVAVLSGGQALEGEERVAEGEGTRVMLEIIMEALAKREG